MVADIFYLLVGFFGYFFGQPLSELFCHLFPIDSAISNFLMIYLLLLLLFVFILLLLKFLLMYLFYFYILEKKRPIGRFLLAKFTLSKNSVKNSVLRANEDLIDLV